MKIAIVQFNPTVGALSANCARMVELYNEAEAKGVDLVVFPEMAVPGYPIEDLARSQHFVADVERAAVFELMGKVNGNAAIIFGTVTSNGPGRRPSNSAVFFHPSSMQQELIKKRELPNYGVFDEKRIFEAQDIEQVKPIEFKGEKIGLMICEDMWLPSVSHKLRSEGANILIAINGSPFENGKNEVRIAQAKARITENQGIRDTPFLYVNLVGGQDELVFDGGSFYLRDEQLTQFPFFTQGVYIIDTENRLQNRTDKKGEKAKSALGIYQACVLGLRDYCTKGGFNSVVLGMSGGVDSGIVAAIAVDALGPDKVNLVRLPSSFSSEGSLLDAQMANQVLGASMRTIAIEPVVNALRAAYSGAQFEDGRGQCSTEEPKLTGVADENIQARARGNILMAISNQEGHLLLTTGNKSEVSVGYATLYGDMAGGFNPIKDVYKTTVFEMCRMRNSLSSSDIERLELLGPVGDLVPDTIINKPPSAELAPDQKDEDSLPPYPVLDAILRSLIERRASIADTVKLGYADEATVRKIAHMIDRAEYKRRQAAPGVKTSNKLHGRDRRVPIINHYRG